MTIQKISSQVIPNINQCKKQSPAFQARPILPTQNVEQDFGWIKMIVAKIKDWQ